MSREAIKAAAVTALEGVSGMKGVERGLKDGTELAATDLPYAYVHSAVETTERLAFRQSARGFTFDVLTWFEGTDQEAEALLVLIQAALETDAPLLALVEEVLVSESGVFQWPESNRVAIVVNVQSGRIE